jgi:transcription antitermination protein NusB
MSDPVTKRPAKPGAGKMAASRRTARQRSSARLAAVQALYQMEMSGTTADQVIGEFVLLRFKEDVDGVKLAEADRKLMSELVRGVTERAGELDDMLAAVLDPDWPLERLETLLRVLLRAGV